MISLSLNHTRDAHWLMPQLQSNSYLLVLRRENMHILTTTLMNIGNLDCESDCLEFISIWPTCPRNEFGLCKYNFNYFLLAWDHTTDIYFRDMVHIYLPVLRGGGSNVGNSLFLFCFTAPEWEVYTEQPMLITVTLLDPE